ncbi:MAG: hypothetical protein K0S76_456 [Herbinix sp.]|nr:hypothetical protein [Herbinix sp.]
MKEIFEKIDAEIAMYRHRIENRTGPCYHDESERLMRYEGRLHEAERIKEIILSEQKEPCYSEHDCEMKENGKCYLDGPCPHLRKPLTIGDKIRESNESLAEMVWKREDESICVYCIHRGNSRCGMNCRQGLIDYLNQPYTNQPTT